jgi:hypothetical protein
MKGKDSVRAKSAIKAIELKFNSEVCSPRDRGQYSELGKPLGVAYGDDYYIEIFTKDGSVISESGHDWCCGKIVNKVLESVGPIIESGYTWLYGPVVERVDIVGNKEFPIIGVCREKDGFYSKIGAEGLTSPSERFRDTEDQRYAPLVKKLLAGQDYTSERELLNAINDGLERVVRSQSEIYSKDQEKGIA